MNTCHMSENSLPSSPFKSLPAPAKYTPSRQCKAAMYLMWFNRVCLAERKGRETFFTGKSPSVCKMAAGDYQKSKQEFYSKCQEYEVGRWIQAPPELDKFLK